MQLYQMQISPNAKRVRVAAAELGIQLDVQTLDPMKGEHKQPDYLAKNPNGKVPTIVDGDYTLWESTAILVYLAQKQGKLIAKDPRGLAETVRWLGWNASHFETALFSVAFERMFKPMMGGEPDQAKIDHAMKDVERFAPVLDKHLTGRDWMIGEFSIVDIALGTSVDFSTMAKVDFSAYKGITTWLSRMRERPSWKA